MTLLYAKPCYKSNIIKGLPCTNMKLQDTSMHSSKVTGSITEVGVAQWLAC